MVEGFMSEPRLIGRSKTLPYGFLGISTLRSFKNAHFALFGLDFFVAQKITKILRSQKIACTNAFGVLVKKDVLFYKKTILFFGKVYDFALTHHKKRSIILLQLC